MRFCILIKRLKQIQNTKVDKSASFCLKIHYRLTHALVTKNNASKLTFESYRGLLMVKPPTHLLQEINSITQAITAHCVYVLM